jgi:glycosyltransferase involved in cell wall biosynthesis
MHEPLRGAGMRVLHVATVDLSLRFLLLPQLLALKREGFEVWTASSPGAHVGEIARAGIRHVAVPMTRRLLSPMRDTRALLSLTKLLRRERFDIVHTHTPKAGLLGRLAARIAGVPLIVHTNHGFLFTTDSPPLRRCFFTTIERLGNRFSQLIFSVNKEDIDIAVKLGLCEPGQMIHLGDGGIGVNIRIFDPRCFDEERRKQIRSELGLSHDTFVVGFVGRIVAEKGILELITAVAFLRQQSYRIDLLVVGPIDTAKRDHVNVPQLGLREGVVFVGLRSDMPAMYAAMDVLVLPSHREGLPLVLVEAAAMGLPVVASDIRGCREVVRQGRTGILVPPRDTQALANAIKEMVVADEDTRSQYRMEARRAAENSFDEEAVFKRVADKYLELAANARLFGGHKV